MADDTRAEALLTAAEFRAMRESLGVNANWLSAELGIHRQTIERYERGTREVPHWLAKTLEKMVEEQDREVDQGVRDAWPEIVIPRLDDDRAPWDKAASRPPGWHRAVAWRVSRVTGARIVYAPE